ncbi:MAG: ATP-binding protein [Bacteroidales bacterium]|nr:ATP-binding protein [Bacteroidales bacterium]
MIPRLLQKIIEKYLFNGKAIIIFGPRQVGKTTLLQMISENTEKKTLYLNCDEPDIRKELTEVSSSQLKSLIGNVEIVMIDEAQRIKNIGLTLKLITDQIKNVQLIATGSSAFELANEINEPLTGRKYEFLLSPISTKEMINYTSILEEKRLLERRLIFGMYPDIINSTGNERDKLNNMIGSYLYKDIFTYQDIRKPDTLEKLLEALALQIGSEVSYNELSRIVQVDFYTIRRYIDLLEKSYVIFRLRSFSRNVRNEIKKSRKIYFYDNGIRNAVISNYNKIDLRTDKGALWENFLVSERLKYLNNNYLFTNKYFWRTQMQQEIDYIEEYDGILHAYEFKWSEKSRKRFPKTFINAYPKSETKVISKENYLDFIG